MSEPCSRWEERLVGLLYEDGDEIERAETRAHVAECAGCRVELEHLIGTRGLLSAWPNVVNVPRMVYVRERSGVASRLQRWAREIRGWGPRAAIGSAVAATVLILAGVAMVAVLDLRVAPDGALRIGLLAGDGTEVEQVDLPVTRSELNTGLAQVIATLEQVLEARGDEERRLLLTAIDERIQEQGLSMSQDLCGAVDDAFVDVQRRHEADLGLIFSGIDEMGAMTATELQRIHNILGSLGLPGPGY